MKKKWIGILLTIALCAGLSGCGGTSPQGSGSSQQEASKETEDSSETADSSEDEDSSEADDASETEETSEAEDSSEEGSSASAEEDDGAYGTVEIENGDRTVTFTKMPEKVLCANLYAAENMAMLGLGDRIVGRPVVRNEADNPLPELADILDPVPQIERSHENAIATGADLVVGQISTYTENAWGSFEQFESKDVNCLVIEGTIVPDETVENIYNDIMNLGKIFKVEDKAQELIDDMKSQIAEVTEKVKDVKEEDKPRVFVMDSFNGNEIYTTSSGLQSNLIELAGGINTTKGQADSRWFTTSVETLVAADPTLIIFNDYGTQTMEEKMDFIKNNPALADVPAVRDENYFVIQLAEVMQDIRAARACRTFAEEFYPELFE